VAAKALRVARSTTRAPNLSGVRVLVIDDNAGSRSILERYLAPCHVQTAVASSGEQGLEMLRRAALEGAPYDLALIDGALTDMSAVDIVNAIAGELGTGPRLILLACTPADYAAASGQRAAFASSLNKPVRRLELYETLAAVMQPGTRAVRAAPGVSLPAPRLGLHVLVVEDNLVNQQICATMLRKLGCEARVVSNGREAVEAVAAAAYDVVLMDCQMPEMDGFAATREIRARELAGNRPRAEGADSPRRVPIIALTANALAGDRERCLAAGMDDYLSKPLTSQQLHQMVARWSTPRAARAEARAVAS
jgi:CheY-like chemotaxis protein